MLISTILSVSLFHFSFVSALPDFPNIHGIFPRQATSDPCCKSCGPIAKVLADCPITQIFCGCDQWVAAAPACQACVIDSHFNSSFATNPGPLLEFFWTWCQCQTECRTVAEAFTGTAPSCNATDLVCGSKILVDDGPGCLCCMKKVDPWFAAAFTVELEHAKSLLAGTLVLPG